jgi:hypothetical protein
LIAKWREQAEEEIAVALRHEAAGASNAAAGCHGRAWQLRDGADQLEALLADAEREKE